MSRHRPFVPWLKTLPWACLLLGLAASSALAGAAGPPGQTGKIGRLFAAASSLEALVDYQRDFYGRHHLVLTFFPAAFTPV